MFSCYRLFGQDAPNLGNPTHLDAAFYYFGIGRALETGHSDMFHLKEFQRYALSERTVFSCPNFVRLFQPPKLADTYMLYYLKTLKQGKHFDYNLRITFQLLIEVILFTQLCSKGEMRRAHLLRVGVQSTYTRTKPHYHLKVVSVRNTGVNSNIDY